MVLFCLLIHFQLLPALCDSVLLDHLKKPTTVAHELVLSCGSLASRLDLFANLHTLVEASDG
jgi:hypothetical protein